MCLCLPAQSGPLFCSSSHFICLVSRAGSPAFETRPPRPGLVSLSRIWWNLTSFPPCGQMVHNTLTSCSICTLGVFWSVRDLHCVQGDIRRDCGSLFDLMPQSLSSLLLQNCLCTGTRVSSVFLWELMRLVCSSEQSYTWVGVCMPVLLAR